MKGPCQSKEPRIAIKTLALHTTLGTTQLREMPEPELPGPKWDLQKEAEALKRLMKGKVVTPSNILAALRVLQFIDGHVTPGQFIRIMRNVRRRLAPSSWL